MIVKHFSEDLENRKKLIKKGIIKDIAKNNKNWVKLNMPRYILITIAILVIISTIILLIVATNESPLEPIAVLMMVFLGVFFSSLPLLLSSVFKNKAIFKCAKPYSENINTEVILNDNYLEITYWVLNEELFFYKPYKLVYDSERRTIYKIEKSRIKNILFEGSVCKIIGEGVIKTPCIDEGGYFYENKEVNNFSLIDNFKEKSFKKKLFEWKKE